MSLGSVSKYLILGAQRSRRKSGQPCRFRGSDSSTGEGRSKKPEGRRGEAIADCRGGPLRPPWEEGLKSGRECTILITSWRFRTLLSPSLSAQLAPTATRDHASGAFAGCWERGARCGDDAGMLPENKDGVLHPWNLEPSRRPGGTPLAQRICPGINSIEGSVRMPMRDLRADEQSHDVS
jgi:hypothetical protein